LQLGTDWTIPAVEPTRGRPSATSILFADQGRAQAAAEAKRLLAKGQRAFAIDPLLLGESKIEGDDFKFALLLACLGDRPLGLQASQVAAIAHWAQAHYQTGPVTLAAVGPRASTFALIAVSLEHKAIGGVEFTGALGSLKELLEQSVRQRDMPEMFSFGLLEEFDIKQLAALLAPRPVVFHRASDRLRAELADFEAWYALCGTKFVPLP
jgi:hypothetical protein